MVQEPDWRFVSFSNLKSPCFTCCHLLSFVFVHFTTHCHFLPLVESFTVIRCHSLSFIIYPCHLSLLVVIRCNSLYYSLSLIIIRCNTGYHSLSLVVIRCHLLYHWLSLVVTWCTARQSFYKQSITLVINNIKVSQKLIFLGLAIDNQLTFKEHRWFMSFCLLKALHFA